MKNYMIPIVKCLVIVLLIFSCKEKTVKLGKNISFQKEENVYYGNDREQVMDLYLPHQEPSKRKDVFIIIHGGGWRGGDKSQLTFFTLSMMKKFPDYIFVNLNYRLATATSSGIPNQTNDIENAVQYIEKKLKYHPKFILLGNSAGAHLSMLYAYHFDAKKRVKAVVNIVGPSDLSDPGFEKYVDYSFVKNYLVNPKAVAPGMSATSFASPINWVDSASVPTLSYYGNRDQVIPLSQKRRLDSVFTQNKVSHESYEFNGGHLDWDKAPNDQFLIDKIAVFLKQSVTL
ncbi:alpha/beta hydrolase [Chryseobacterium herbae]|uniref:Alpha/beta hydrolase n=1 Tax=Chryseobacterium herbae TaxID=2976476 RepID=A0ABT2IXF1_9FLAO|nr:alpha/beta hydrolase [Chryseobacterium sp. pc1-10]MCT2562990.1 alpha/beta hydrolase [Chryseobacterium sp. pc1-10]